VHGRQREEIGGGVETFDVAARSGEHDRPGDLGRARVRAADGVVPDDHERRAARRLALPEREQRVDAFRRKPVPTRSTTGWSDAIPSSARTAAPSPAPCRMKAPDVDAVVQHRDLGRRQRG
jgi:hypothetical protein